MSCFTTGADRLQYGHWKSLHSTMVTLAIAGPKDAASAGTSTFLTTAGGTGGGHRLLLDLGVHLAGRDALLHQGLGLGQLLVDQAAELLERRRAARAAAAR